MARAWHPLVLVLLVLSATLGLSVTGCGDDDLPNDAMVDGDRPAPRLEIGTGGIGMFTPIDDGDTVLLVRGPQGGQHVWVSLRAANLDTRPALIRLLFERERDGWTASIPYQVRLSFTDDVPVDADYQQISGLQLIVPEADDVLGGERMIIHARVSENFTGGASVEAAIGVAVQWDPNNPPGFRGDGGIGADAGIDADASALGLDGGT